MNNKNNNKFRNQLPLENSKEIIMRNKLLTVIGAILTNYYVFFSTKFFPKKYTNSSRTLSKLDSSEEISKATMEFNRYIKYGQLSKKKIYNKTILEIGTGANHLVPLYFIAAGAKRVVTIDKFHCLRNKDELLILYKKFYESLSKEEKLNVNKALTFNNSSFDINKKYLDYRNIEIEKLEEQEKFDINISNTVLEHIYNIDGAIKKIVKVIKHNGKMLALVDINDHGLFSKYHGQLYYLKINSWLWNMMTKHIGRVNRHHINVYEKILKKYGFKSKIYVAKIRLQSELLKKFVEKPLKGKEYSVEIDIINAEKSHFYKIFRDMDELSLIAETFFINATKK